MPHLLFHLLGRGYDSVARLALESKLSDPLDRISNMEALVERRHNIGSNGYLIKIKSAKLIIVRSQTLRVADLVLKIARHIQKGLGTSKSTHKLEEHYIVRESYDSDFFLISWPISENLQAFVNAEWLKLYYP